MYQTRSLCFFCFVVIVAFVCLQQLLKPDEPTLQLHTLHLGKSVGLTGEDHELGSNVGSDHEEVAETEEYIEKSEIFNEKIKYTGSITVVPDKKFLLCIFAKAGTTSFFHFMFEGLMGKKFVLENGIYVQNLEGPQWEKKMKSIRKIGEKDALAAAFADPSYYRVMVTRDPVKRLISGYINKLACGNQGVDANDRKTFVPGLIKLASKHDQTISQKKWANEGCLSLDEFLVLLKAIGEGNHQHELDSHFRNQDCIPEVIPYDDHFFTENLSSVDVETLKQRLGLFEEAQLRHTHASVNHGSLKINSSQVEVLKWFSSLP